MLDLEPIKKNGSGYRLNRISMLPGRQQHATDLRRLQTGGKESDALLEKTMDDNQIFVLKNLRNAAGKSKIEPFNTLGQAIQIDFM